MQKNAIEISNLSKNYENFKLKDITFKVPEGSIVGIIGENGAGKTTIIIKSILNIIKKDSGDITILENEELNKNIKEQIGVVFGGSNFPEELNAKEINNSLKNIYKNWNEEKYYGLLYKLKIPLNQKIKNYSRGMKMKLSILVALSHDTKLLILDEAQMD